jgi:hypothetical protein
MTESEMIGFERKALHNDAAEKHLVELVFCIRRAGCSRNEELMGI